MKASAAKRVTEKADAWFEIKISGCEGCDDLIFCKADVRDVCPSHRNKPS